MKTWLIVATLGLALGGCDDARKASANTSASSSVSAIAGDNVAIAVDSSTGNIAVNVPGFNGALQVPPKMISSANFDIDGVKLYPGTKIGNVDVRTTNGDSIVRVGFTSPADVAAVRDHLAKGFATKGVAATSTADGLTGTSADGDRFTVALSPEGSGQTRGVATIVDAKK